MSAALRDREAEAGLFRANGAAVEAFKDARQFRLLNVLNAAM
ncbi:MAG TPA: hypothetical protein VKV96_17370 [Roseiarcus sp.]|nr:hypothetical protein [Roseiarcus sp.]